MRLHDVTLIWLQIPKTRKANWKKKILKIHLKANAGKSRQSWVCLCEKGYNKRWASAQHSKNRNPISYGPFGSFRAVCVFKKGKLLSASYSRRIYQVCVHKSIRNTKSLSTIRVLEGVFYTFRNPDRIVSDRGTSFTSHVFKRFCINKGIKHVLNSVASPRSNGQVERYNRTIYICNSSVWYP